jgi:sporulation protein YlmC with PRC-barrel domain
LKIKDELIGKEVLDSKGHELGKVDDIDVDFDSDRIDSIILHEGGRLRGRDRVIPYSMIETVGERILLKKSGERESREEDYDERREGIM